jgi:RNA polymerase sigma-70 factor (ECF subfamily)
MARFNDEDRIGQLFTDYADGLLGFLVFRTGDRALAEDVLADAFELALKSRRGPRGGSEKSWIYTIALNRLRDVARRRGAEERALERVGVAAGPRSDLDVADDRDVVRRALVNLPDEERESIALRYGGDLSLKEIAAVTAQKQTTVEGRIYRGLARLREEIR